MAVQSETRLLLADNSAGSSAPIVIPVIDTDLVADEEWGEDPGARGSRQRFACGSRVLKHDVVGGFTCQPSETIMDWLIRRMIGDNISGYPVSPAVPGATLPIIYGYLDKGPNIYRFDTMVIESVILSFTEGNYVTARVNLMGSKQTGGVTWPASPPTMACEEEYAASDVTFTLASTAWSFKSGSLTIRNVIVGSQENTLYRANFESNNLIVDLDLQTGVRSDTQALYGRGIAGDDSVTLALVNSDATYTMTFDNLKIPGRGPILSGLEWIQNLTGRAYAKTGNMISIAKT